MTPRKRKAQPINTPDKEVDDFYFQNVDSSFRDYSPNLSLNNLTAELKVFRCTIKRFFEMAMAEQPDLKSMGEAVHRIGTAVVQVSRLISVIHKLEKDQSPVNELNKAIEEILSDLHTNATEEE